MLLGIYVGDLRLGSSPFVLIRQLPENLGLPWTGIADYLTRIPQFADGRGLNPLLQNYWMTIHPPTLFLGFAATLVPFAYAIAGLWKGRFREWMAPALPWTFFGVMVLGIGILMGGAWAYEALSFGGFWAWDPVENASLVPWLTLVAAGHLMLVNKRKETSLFTTLLLTLLTFLLVLYSTFLTRSGVLGDTSVHSFTGEGMLPGLLVFMLTFVWLSVVMLLKAGTALVLHDGLGGVAGHRYRFRDPDGGDPGLPRGCRAAPADGLPRLPETGTGRGLVDARILDVHRSVNVALERYADHLQHLGAGDQPDAGADQGALGRSG